VVDSCYALRDDGEIIRERWPQYARDKGLNPIVAERPVDQGLFQWLTALQHRVAVCRTSMEDPHRRGELDWQRLSLISVQTAWMVSSLLRATSSNACHIGRSSADSCVCGRSRHCD
jgi:hypothetical protein